MGNRKITIHDIAAKLGISASTVSRALNGHSRISKNTRDLIKKTAIELNYKPNNLASSFRKGKSNSIGIIIPRINRHFFSNTISGMESITNPAGYNLMICQTNESAEEEAKSILNLISSRVDGIIMSVSVETKDTKHIEAAISEGIPVVQFDRISPQLDIDKVINDNKTASYLITNHLINQGYKNIVHCAGPQHNTVYFDRLNGYKQAMKKAKLNLQIVNMAENLTRHDGADLAKKWIQEGNIPEAISTSSDYLSLGIYIELKKAGYKIPEDVAITGFSNEPFTEYLEPGITTLEQHGLEMGKSAAKLLIERLTSTRKIPVSRMITIQPELLVRGSTLRSELLINNKIIT